MSFGLTRKTDYALVALAALAREKQEGEETLSARYISEQYDLPLPLLMNALKELHRSEIISSRRGAGGGYFLDRNPEDISIQEIIEVMEGPVSMTLCTDHDVHEEDVECASSCLKAHSCPISEPMGRLNTMLGGFLSQITLKSLIDPIFPMPFVGVRV